MMDNEQPNDLSSGSVEREDSDIMSPSEFSKLQRRIDLRIMPLLCVAYLVMRIDVNNVANAAIMNLEQGHGIKKDLKLNPTQWNWAIACFFYPYALLEPISPLLMKSTTPSFWMGRIMITWGIVVCCIASVQNFRDLVITRMLLGAAESGFYPCVVYHLAFWFQPSELAIRIALFQSCGQISGLVGGFLAFAVSYADGRIPGWRWLFIIEGLPAIALGIVTLIVLPDYPHTATFLSEKEKRAITEHLSSVSSPNATSKTWDLSQILRLARDASFWTFSAAWLCHAVGGFGISYFLPTVIYEQGFTTSALSNVLSMPPALAGFILVNVMGWLVQKKAWNAFQTAMCLLFINVMCYVFLIIVHVSTFHYVCLVISVATAGAVQPVLWPSRIKAARGTSATGIAIGFTNALAQFSGILGPTLFSSKYGPSYHVSFFACIGILVGGIIAVGLSGLVTGGLYESKRGDHDGHMGEKRTK